MTLVYYYDAAPLTHGVKPSAVNLPTRADNGEAAMGGVPVEDPDADLAIVGHRPFYVTETECAQPRLWTGWTQERGIGRAAERGLIGSEDARLHDMTIVEYNAVFGFLQCSGTDAKRPAETWKARLDWIVASDYLSPFLEDTGYVASDPVLDPFYLGRPMDAADYTGQTPTAVLDDLVGRLPGFYMRYFVFWDTDAAAFGLFINPDSQSIGDSTLSISNDIDDVDNTTCFAPDNVAKLAREPDQVYSGVTVVYSHGTKRLYRSRASTAATYMPRETEIERPFTGAASTATLQAEAFLDRHAVEMDRITCTILVPAASAGLVRAGQHIDVKFTHLPGYETSTTMFVVGCTPTPVDDLAKYYEVALELVALWAAPPPVAGDCDTTWAHVDDASPRCTGPRHADGVDRASTSRRCRGRCSCSAGASARTRTHGNARGMGDVAPASRRWHDVDVEPAALQHRLQAGGLGHRVVHGQRDLQQLARVRPEHLGRGGDRPLHVAAAPVQRGTTANAITRSSPSPPTPGNIDRHVLPDGQRAEAPSPTTGRRLDRAVPARGARGDAA